MAVVCAVLGLVACASDVANVASDASSDAASADADEGAHEARQAAAFVYQSVTPNQNNNRIGLTYDGKNVDISDFDVLTVMKGGKLAYGDPVFSRLSNGRWAMTAWSGFEDSHGNGQLMLHEAACPNVVEADIKYLGARTGPGCQAAKIVTSGHTSQIFESSGSNYMLHAISGELYLTRLTDGTHAATELGGLCIRSTPVTKISDLAWGESTLILSKTLATGLLLSDSGIARRKDGT